jgi:hypothetical protein
LCPSVCPFVRLSVCPWVYGLRSRSPVSGLRSTVYGLRSTVSGLRSTVYGLRSPVYGLRSTVYGLRSTVYGLRSTVYGLRSPVYGLRSTVYGLRSPVYGLRSTVYSLRSTVYGLQSTVYSLQSTVYGLRSQQLSKKNFSLQAIPFKSPVANQTRYLLHLKNCLDVRMLLCLTTLVPDGEGHRDSTITGSQPGLKPRGNSSGGAK